MKHFEVQTFHAGVKYLTVWLERDNLSMSITIPVESYKLFLLSKDKLVWELNFSCAGEHQQQEGIMSYEEYWESQYVTEDLYEYITTHPIRYRGVVRDNSVESILKGFEHYKIFNK